jgi:hypothetical protein
MSSTVKIATTMRPHEEIEVSEAEATDLFRAGVLAKVNGKAVTEKTKEAAVNGGNGN